MLKKCLIGCGIAAVLGIGLAVGLGVVLVRAALAMTQPVVDSSEQFLALLGQGKTAEAYASTADGFRAQQDEASFTAAVKQLGLTDYSTVSWHSRQFENQEGAVEGTLTTKQSGTRPVVVRLVQEGGTWKVLGVRYGGVDLAAMKVPPPLPPEADVKRNDVAVPPAVRVQHPTPVPPEAELERMVAEALLDFNQAVRAKDFTALYGKVSDELKKVTTPELMRQAFQEFLDKDVDISPINGLKPRLAPPAAINGRGVLAVEGHYATRPSPVRFRLQYVEEHDGWKLTTIWVGVGKGGTVE
jgi:hypothetical protein